MYTDKILKRRKFPRVLKYAMFKETGQHCVYCGDMYYLRQLTADHVIPTSQYGANNINNCVPACANCNLEKDDDSLLMFLFKRLHKKTLMVCEEMVDRSVEMS